MTTDAEMALKALGWTAGLPPPQYRRQDCIFLFSDGTFSAGQHKRSVIGHVLPIVDNDYLHDSAMDARTEYAVAWRIR